MMVTLMPEYMCILVHSNHKYVSTLKETLDHSSNPHLPHNDPSKPELYIFLSTDHIIIIILY